MCQSEWIYSKTHDCINYIDIFLLLKCAFSTNITHHRFSHSDDVRYNSLRLESPKVWRPDPPEPDLDLVGDAKSTRTPHMLVNTLQITLGINNLTWTSNKKNQVRATTLLGNKTVSTRGKRIYDGGYLLFCYLSFCYGMHYARRKKTSFFV